MGTPSVKRDGSGVFTAIFNNQQHWAYFCSVVVIGMLENPREALPAAIWEFHVTSGQRSSLRFIIDLLLRNCCCCCCSKYVCVFRCEKLFLLPFMLLHGCVYMYVVTNIKEWAFISYYWWNSISTALPCPLSIIFHRAPAAVIGLLFIITWPHSFCTILLLPIPILSVFDRSEDHIYEVAPVSGSLESLLAITVWGREKCSGIILFWIELRFVLITYRARMISNAQPVKIPSRLWCI